MRTGKGKLIYERGSQSPRLHRFPSLLNLMIPSFAGLRRTPESCRTTRNTLISKPANTSGSQCTKTRLRIPVASDAPQRRQSKVPDACHPASAYKDLYTNQQKHAFVATTPLLPQARVDGLPSIIRSLIPGIVQLSYRGKR